MNFDEARNATEQIFSNPEISNDNYVEEPTAEDSNVQNEAIVDENQGQVSPEDVGITEKAVSTAEQTLAMLQQERQANEQLRQRLSELESMSNQQSEQVVAAEEARAMTDEIPILDISNMAFDDDETIQQNVSCDAIRKKKQEFIEHVKKEEEATGRKAYTKDYTRYSMDDDVHLTDDESKPSVLDDEKHFKPDEDDPHIFIIPESSFGTDEYDTMEVYRFTDGIFSDEVYEEIDTDVELFGVTAIQMLAFYGKDIVYVRNTRTQMDYCITNDERPFDVARTDYYGRG